MEKDKFITKLVYDEELTVKDIRKQVSYMCKSLGVVPPLPETSSVFTQADQCFTALRKKLWTEDEIDHTVIDAVFLLFGLTNYMVKEGNNLTALYNDDIFKILFQGEQMPLRDGSGNRLSEEQVCELIPRKIKPLREFCKLQRLEVKTNLGGKSLAGKMPRKTEDVRNDAIDAYKKKLRERPEKPKQTVRLQAPKTEKGSTGSVTFGQLHPRHGLMSVKTARSKEREPNLQNEIKIVRKILETHGHPNIVTYFETYDGSENAEALPQLKMEQLECTLGDGLETQMNKMQRLKDEMQTQKDEEKRGWHPLTILLDVARGLEFLHTEIKIIHMDIKLNNIMLNTAGRAKLIDFDSAQQEGGSKYRSSSMNDPSIMENRKNGASFDIDICSWAKVSKQIYTHLKLDIPGSLDKLFDRCNNIHYEDRPSSTMVVKELENMINEIRGGTLENPVFLEPFMSEPTWYPYNYKTSNRTTGITSNEDVMNRALAYSNKECALTSISKPTKTGYVIRIATINALNLKLKGPEETQSKRVDGLVELITGQQMDLVAIQELCGTEDGTNMQQGLQNKLQEHDETWRVGLSLILTRSGPKKERAAFAYRSPLVSFKCDGELDLGVGERKVYLAKFRVGATRFLIGTAHFDPKAKNPAEQIPPLISSYNDLEEQDRFHKDTSHVFLGDLNLPCKDTAWIPFYKLGWNPCFPANIATNKNDSIQWDNIFLKSNCKLIQCYKSQESKKEDGLKSDHSCLIVDLQYAHGETEGETGSLGLN